MYQSHAMLANYVFSLQLLEGPCRCNGFVVMCIYAGKTCDITVSVHAHSQVLYSQLTVHSDAGICHL